MALLSQLETGLTLGVLYSFPDAQFCVSFCPHLNCQRQEISEAKARLGGAAKLALYFKRSHVLHTAPVTTEGESSACRFWPVREYPWGSCEALSSRHSDLAALKKLLFEVRLSPQV